MRRWWCCADMHAVRPPSRVCAQIDAKVDALKAAGFSAAEGMYCQEATPEEMEAYRLKKSRGADDPLTFINKSKEEAGGGGDGYDYV